MKLKPSFLLVLLLPIVSCTGGGNEENTDKPVEIPTPTKLSVDFSNIHPYAYKGEALDLSGLSVKLKKYIDNAWTTGEDISEYTVTPQNGTILESAGPLKITVTSPKYSSLTYTYSIKVIDSSLYKVNDNFTTASLTYEDIEGEHPLYLSTLANNAGTTYVDSLSKDQKILVVPYYFAGEEETATEENRALINKVFFGSQEDAEALNQPYTLKSYYETSSFGKFAVNGFVCPWIKSHVGSGYADDLSGGGVDAAKDIKLQYLSEYEKDGHGLLGEDAPSWAEFDGDGDGVLDFLWIIYSHPMTFGTQNWWAYTVHDAFTEPKNIVQPALRTFCWASIDFISGGKPHVIVHESGHSFGLVDYYCYNNSWSPMGGIAMMDHNIGEQDSYSKFSLGWIAPKVVDQDAIIDLKPYATSGEAILLPSPSYNGTAFDEYFLLQFDTPTGLNTRDYIFGSGDAKKGFLEPGLRLLHVDSRVKNGTIKTIEEDHPELGTALAYDNSKFGRGSSNKAESCTTDYFEASKNASNSNRSYALLTTIPASYESSRNTINSKGVVLDDNALFHVGDLFDLNKGWKDFMPSYSNLWNKARSHNKDDYDAVNIDNSYTIDFTFEVIEMDNSHVKVKIDYKK